MGQSNALVQYGVLLSEYDVKQYWDLRTSSSGSGALRAYIVSLRQRITISNADANSFDALNPITEYSGYPILVVQQVVPSTQAQNLSYYLEDYSPKTLNAAVTTNQSAGTSKTADNTVQHTAGSSTSVTNSYEVSASLGFFGEDPTGSVSAGFGHSTTDTAENSETRGRSSGRGADAQTGSAMSIKDWGSYAFLDANKQQPAWVWGQEYPWNVIDFRSAKSSNDADILIPAFVSKRLYDGVTVFPPSDISQFGLNFVANAQWVFYVDGAAGAIDETVSFAHSITYWEGSHSALDANTAKASIAQIATSTSIESVTLNLPLLALDPITEPGARNGAIIGFVKSEFVTPPGGGSPFRLKSGSNNLYVSGSGFDGLTNENSVLTASAVTASTPAKLTLHFKMTDENLELTLYFKHWKTTPSGCVMNIAINEADPDHPVTPIVRHVDALDAGSGTDNISAVTLRKRDYTSTDFYDYLVMGLNTVVVTIAAGRWAAERAVMPCALLLSVRFARASRGPLRQHN